MSIWEEFGQVLGSEEMGISGRGCWVLVLENGGVGDVSGLVSWSWRGGEGCWVLGEFLGWIWKDFAGAGGSGFKGKEEEEECRILAEGRRRNC